jgi:hypothetical protein
MQPKYNTFVILNDLCVNPILTTKTMSKLSNTVQELVVDNKVEEALNMMIDFFQKKDLERLKTCIELKRQLHQYENDNLLNVIDAEDYNVNVNRIGMAVMDVVTEIDDGRWSNITEPIEIKERSRKSIRETVDKLTKRDFLFAGLGSVGLIAFFIWLYRPTNPKTEVVVNPKNTKVVIPPVPPIFRSEGDMYEDARILRNNDKFEAAIKLCDTILMANKCHWKSLNLIAECYINIHTLKTKEDHSPELIKARNSAYEAWECNKNDEKGYINSTLAQIFAIEENDSKFLFHIEKALQKGLKIGEYDYANEPGFSNYAKNAKFLKLLKDYKQ